MNAQPPQCRDILWESTGMYGESQVRAVDLQTGKVLQSTDLIKADFGEGLARDSNGHLVQLLWRTGKTYKYDAKTLQKVMMSSMPRRCHRPLAPPPSCSSSAPSCGCFSR